MYLAKSENQKPNTRGARAHVAKYFLMGANNVKIIGLHFITTPSARRTEIWIVDTCVSMELWENRITFGRGS